MGIVYEGRDPNLDRRVAIKTVKVENLSEEAAAEYESRFRTEARSAARLQHPNIVSVYDSDRHGNMAFLVMEYIHGDDLKHHLDRGERYSLEQSLKMIRDLLSALDYAHQQGIVHRDIKPANLLIEAGGRVKLTDFGVARMQDSGDATRTQGSMVGTLKYMSPEQVQGQKIDSRADLFSVGVVLYQLLTDKRPFDGDNDFSIIHQIIGHTPPPPSSFNARLPSAIDAVVARALAKDREQRFATARDFASALQSAMRRAEDATIIPPADPAKKIEATGGASGSGAGSLPLGGPTVTQELELVYWKDVKDSTDPDELRGFLERFPGGVYADLARRRMRKLAEVATGDQTILSGLSPPGPNQDLEPTRLRADTVPTGMTVVAGLEGGSLPPAPAAASRIPDEPEAAMPAATSEPTRKRVPAAMLAGVAALVIGGIAAFALMGKGASVPLASSISTAMPPPVSAVPLPPPAVPVAATPKAAAVDTAAAPLSAGPAAVAAAPATSAPVVQAPAIVAAGPAAPPAKSASTAHRPSRSRTAVAGGSSETAAASPRSRDDIRPVQNTLFAGPIESCKDKFFVVREFCLAQHCDKPGTRNHPLCVKRREEARVREESKVRN